MDSFSYGISGNKATDVLVKKGTQIETYPSITEYRRAVAVIQQKRYKISNEKHEIIQIKNVKW